MTKTTEEFIQQAKKVHGDKYDYSLTQYINAKTPIKFIGRYGILSQLPVNHLRSNNESIRSAIDKTSYWINMAKEIHGNYYDYSLVKYVNNSTKVKIICPVHDVFEQIPGDHLRSYIDIKHFCKKRITNTEEFIDKSNKLYDNFYIYDKTVYVGNKEKVIITHPLYGDFAQTPSSHLSGRRGSILSAVDKNEWTVKVFKEIHGDKYDYSQVEYKSAKDDKVKIYCKKHKKYFYQYANNHSQGEGCPLCGHEISGEKNTKSLEKFIKQAKIVHGDDYEYTKVEYVNTNEPVIITCPIHEDFEQIPNSHLKGQGCPECASKRRGWEYSKWQKAGENSNYFDSFKVYILRCWNKDEEFYKIGKTFYTVGKRFSGKRLMPYQYEIIKEISGEARKISELEVSLQNENKEYKYIPKLPFGGTTECYSDISKLKV